jgi:hypothetical protein
MQVKILRKNRIRTMSINGVLSNYQIANSQWEDDFCVRTMLEEGTITKEEVLGACPMQCRRGKLLSSSRTADDTVIITHLPENGTKVTCEGGYSQAFHHQFEYGAFHDKS